ncbi:glutamate cyclase domain-containing protein [Pyrococcus yayanosii]|uniref:D-glutamate cyclase-like C-terminal domain-containing protein n=1 Tax=Pyrococcus yayanosii (strain CH1 / JCM 16557) TaxID=529709 RepID=F8AFL2_PYRYC|nr:glutamate cyclase domain-containing protein [Pyrococcus yayanosii]AEH24978.1 hypothetical protein PYCH_13060 [Pyrococcus yayanosii CH1]
MIAHLIATDVGGRGIGRIYPEYRVREGDYLERAAQLVLKNLKRILIVADFPIPPTMLPETDGPPGALALAFAIEELGGRADILTGERTAKAISRFYEHVKTELPNPSRYSLLISVETPGRARDGRYYSMSGLEIKVRPYDGLFIEARRLGIPTIGVGDGGNEIGMGKIRGLIDDRFASVVETKELIIAGVSNWGAYGLVGQLSLMEGRGLLGDFNEEIILKALVEEGLIDGILKRPALSVDGLSLELHTRFLGLLQAIVKAKLSL